MYKINNKKKLQIFILVGEESGDLIASGLIKELKKNYNKMQIDFFGVTGPRMLDLGVKSLLEYNKINYLGFFEVMLNYIPLKLNKPTYYSIYGNWSVILFIILTFLLQILITRILKVKKITC